MNKYEISKIQNYLYRYEMFLKNNMVAEADLEIEKFLNYINYKHKSTDTTNRMREITEFLAHHASFVGREQATKDLQRGISLLNNNRRNSPIEAKNILKEDGIFLQKTYDSLCDVCKNYPPNIIIKFIKKGILNNVIFDTKNNKQIDTKKLLNGININLAKGGY